MPRRPLEHVQMHLIVQWVTEGLTQRELVQSLGFSQCCKSRVKLLCDEWYSHICLGDDNDTQPLPRTDNELFKDNNQPTLLLASLWRYITQLV